MAKQINRNFNAKLHQVNEDHKGVEFVSLQNEWYSKLADSGFKDIEVVSKKTGNTDPGLIMGSETYLKKKIKTNGTEATIYFYNLMQNYLTHNPNWSSIVKDRYIASSFVNGVSYRTIVKQHRLEHPRRKQFSVFIVFQVVKQFVALAMQWNKVDVEGLTYQAKLDQLEELNGGES